MSKFTHEDAMRLIKKMRVNYGKKFSDQWAGVEPYDLADEMVDQYQGLTSQNFLAGIERMKTESWPPTIPEFKNWCIGGTIAMGVSLFRSKNAALANIEAWLSDSTTKITSAEKEAYNRCYGMFNDLKWNYSDKQKFHTYLAFKDFYDEVVKELVAKGESQSIWIEPPKIESKAKGIKKDYLKLSPEEQEESEKRELRVKELLASGMSMPEAYLQIAKESKK
jgi:uncharacterized protein YoaH (UPF0181 family)